MNRQTDPESVGFLVNEVARLFRADVDRLIGEAGIELTPGEARALGYAARAGTVRQSVLAERMGIEAMTVCGFIDRLEARGLVTRSVDPTDRRAKLVHLEPAADAMLARLRAIWAEAEINASEGIGASEWNAFQALLVRVRGSLIRRRADNEKTSAA